MRTILQKHTSKFAAALFNSLGIIACVSVTACGNKGKQTDAQVEKLKSDLKKKCTILQNEDAEKIAVFLSKNKKGINNLTENDLKKIFNDTTKVKDVAGKLGIELSNSNLDDEKKKKIDEVLNELNGNAALEGLESDLRRKVAEKIFDNKIDIKNGKEVENVVNKVVDEKKQKEISIKIGKNGKVTIVGNSGTNEFDLDQIANFKNFVKALNDKDIKAVDGTWSLAFESENVKICGCKTGFSVVEIFEDLVKCLVRLSKVNNFQLPDLQLEVDEGVLSLNTVDCSNVAFYKGGGFWNLVKDHVDLFGITTDKFEIEGKEDNGTKIVSINGFDSSLNWSDVVTEGNQFVEGENWDKIFKIKDGTTVVNTNDSENKKENVTVSFADGKCTWNDSNEGESKVVLKDLGALEQLVKDLKMVETLKVAENKVFSLKFKGKNVEICGGTGFDITGNTDFDALLGYVAELNILNVCGNSFNIKIVAKGSEIELNNEKVDDTFIQKAAFWSAVEKHEELFSCLKSKRIDVKRTDDNDKHVKIGDLELEFDVLNEGMDDIDEKWNGIFSLSND